MATSHLASTLRHVTNRKLSKLASQQDTFEAHKARIIEAVDHEPNTAKKLGLLIEGHKENEITWQLNDKFLSNIEKGLKLSEHDGSVSESMLLNWCSTLRSNLDACSAKYQYASLFGRAVTEWIEKPDNQFKDRLNDDGSTGQGQGAENPMEIDTPGTENMVRGDLGEQRKLLDSLWFGDDGVDTDEVEGYLEKLFSSPKPKDGSPTPLETLRSEVSRLDLRPKIDVHMLRQAIRRVTGMNLFVGEKRQALLSLESQDEVLQEMVDVMQMDLNPIDNWNWEGPVSVGFRRQVNLKARAFTDEEIHVALLVCIFGGLLSAKLKEAFSSHFHSGAWSCESAVVPKSGKLRRQYFLGQDAVNTEEAVSVCGKRRERFQKRFFLAQLPDHLGHDVPYTEDNAGNFTDAEPHAIRQELLRLMSTEMMLHTTLYGEFTVFQTDIRLFHPSISHTAILAILKFFNLDPKWLKIVENFLKPSIFWAQDGSDTQPKVRQRGTSIGHLLSTVLGETMMFVLDFAVNQRTRGSFLYRLHDDISFWGREKTCVEAWKTIEEFTEVMGLSLNKHKTGSAKVFAKNASPSTRKPISDALPKGKVSWGLLVLNADQGAWTIDKDLLNMHIAEFRRQLEASKSTMAWVQRWNSYVAKFLTPNFGRPCRCLGPSHVKRVLEALRDLQSSIFGGTGDRPSSVTDYLRRRIGSDFGVSDIPEAFIFWPHELGGLELLNPIVSFHYPTHYKEDAEENRNLFEKAIEEDNVYWEKLRDSWNEGKRPLRHEVNIPKVVLDDMREDDTFMSLEEYTRYRERTSSKLFGVYRQLLQDPGQEEINLDLDLKHALKTATSNARAIGKVDRWQNMVPYWRWIIGLHGHEVKDRFGGLVMGEKELLPLGLLQMLQSDRVRWQD